MQLSLSRLARQWYESFDDEDRIIHKLVSHNFSAAIWNQLQSIENELERKSLFKSICSKLQRSLTNKNIRWNPMYFTAKEWHECQGITNLETTFIRRPWIRIPEIFDKIAKRIADRNQSKYALRVLVGLRENLRTKEIAKREGLSIVKVTVLIREIDRICAEICFE